MTGRLFAHLRGQWTGALALFLVLSGGTAWAVDEWTGANIQNGTLTSADYKNNDIRSIDVRNDTFAGGGLTGADIAPNALTGADIANLAVGTGELAQLPGARAKATTVQSLPHATPQGVALDSEVFDTGGLYTPPNDTMTISVPGTYLLTAQLNYAADADGLRQLRIKVNSAVAASASAAATSGVNTIVPLSTIARLSAGDVLSIEAYQTAGNNLDTSPFTDVGYAYLAVQWLSP
jgi:hypothetical protein